MAHTDARVAAVRRFGRFYTQRIQPCRKPSRHKMVAGGKPGAVRTGHARRQHRDGTRARAGPGQRLSQPHPEPVRGRGAAGPRALRRGRPRPAAAPDHPGPRRFRAAQRAPGRAGGADAGRAGGCRGDRPGGGDEADRDAAERCAWPRMAAARTAAGRSGLGVARHGALYAQEYGWNLEFEVLVAGIIAEAMAKFDPEREAPGSPNATACRWVRCSWCASTTRRRSCACCWWNRRRGAWASACGWWTHARTSRAGRAIGASHCGPTRCSRRRGTFTRGPATGLSSRRRSGDSARS